MPTINQGSSATVTVDAGKMIIISTPGETIVDRVSGLPDAGYASDRILAGERGYGKRDLPFILKVKALSGTTTYTVAYPTVRATDVEFRRADTGEIDALIDPETGEAVALGAGAAPSIAWADITGKPATFAPTIGTTATTAKAGNYAPPNAAAAVRGLVLQATAQADSAAADVPALLSDFNALLAKLRTAGVIAP